MKIGITEQGDAGRDFSWIEKHKEMDFSILITKNVDNSRFQEEVIKTKNTIVHATITGLGKEIEPNVSDYKITTESFKKLIDNIGKNRCVLRIDPIIPEEKYLTNVFNILDIMKGCIDRVRFSFIDNYKHISNRNFNLPWISFNPPIDNICKTLDMLGDYSSDFQFEVCAENITSDWIEYIGCVSKKDFEALDTLIPRSLIIGNQRKLCKCLSNKTELLSNRKQCENGCLYCYWR